MSAISDRYDVAVVGGGPAGSSLAIRLALNGLNVILVERAFFPREKLCGEFISPECLSHFAELGVLDEIRSKNPAEVRQTVFYSRSGKGVAIPSEWFGGTAASGVGLSRAQMDHCLIDRARRVGVGVREGATATGTITRAGNSIEGISVKDKNGVSEVRARLVVDATGRQRVLANRVETERVRRADLVAFKAHFTGARISDNACEIYAYSGGYGGCNQVENELFNVCFIVSARAAKGLSSDPMQAVDKILCKNPRAIKVLGNAKMAGEWQAVAISQFGRSGLTPMTGLITIGDAAAFIDPFTGSGILLALESSRVAAQSISAYFHENLEFDSFAEGYSLSYSAAFDRRLRFCSILRYATVFPFLAETLITALGFSSGLSRRLALSTRRC